MPGIMPRCPMRLGTFLLSLAMPYKVDFCRNENFI